MKAFRSALWFAAAVFMTAPAALTAQSQPPSLLARSMEAPAMKAPEAETPEEAAAMKGMKSEQRFMVEAYMGNLAEVAFGQLAQQKGQSQAAKDFGQKLVDDHARANATVGKYLDEQQVQHPIHVPRSALKVFTALTEVPDQDFDQAFAKAMAMEHQNDIAKYQRWSKRAQSDTVKGYLKDTLPVLEKHLEMARDLPKGAPGKA